MKKLKIIYLTALLLISNTLSAQYQSIFGKTQTSWSMLSIGATPEFLMCEVDSAWILYGQDTVFQGNSFKPLKVLENEFPAGIRAFVREDSLGGVWYRSIGYDTSIYKIMDMSLTVNDSFYFDYGKYGYYVQVDTVYYLNARKIIVLDQGLSITTRVGPQVNKEIKYTMIEGVGVSTRGGVFFDTYGILKYQWKDSLLAYSSYDYPAVFDSSLLSCDSIDTSTSLFEQKKSESRIQISPNPLNGTASLSLKGVKAEKIELIDINGRLVKTFPRNTKKLDFSAVLNGIYFVRVSTVKQGQFNKKIVVQK